MGSAVSGYFHVLFRIKHFNLNQIQANSTSRFGTDVVDDYNVEL